MIKKLFIASLLIVALPVSAQTAADTARTWMNPSSGTQTGTLSTPGASAGAPGTVSGYTPLEPLKGGFANYRNFGEYLATVYRLIITVGALIAVVMLVTGGVRYMLSEAFTDIDKAKLRIRSALYGLLILVGSFLILYTINPNLLKFDLLIPPLKNQGQSGFSVPTGGANVAQNLGDSSNASITNWNGFSSLSATQGYAVNQALGCSFYNIACLGSQKYITYYSENTNRNDVQQAIREYTSGCSGVSNAFIGNVKTLDGSLVGSPGQTMLVCAGPLQ